VLEPLIPAELRKKIQETPQKTGFKKSLSKNKETQGKSFHSILENQVEDNFITETDSFLDSLENLEQDFLEKPNITTMGSYRKAIGDFLRKVTSNYAHMDFYRTRRGQQTTFRIWQILDTELDKTYREVLSGQVKAFMLLDKLQEIKGLIIDLKVGKEEKQ